MDCKCFCEEVHPQPGLSYNLSILEPYRGRVITPAMGSFCSLCHIFLNWTDIFYADRGNYSERRKKCLNALRKEAWILRQVSYWTILNVEYMLFASPVLVQNSNLWSPLRGLIAFTSATSSLFMELWGHCSEQSPGSKNLCTKKANKQEKQFKMKVLIHVSLSGFCGINLAFLTFK